MSHDETYGVNKLLYINNPGFGRVVEMVVNLYLTKII